MVIHLSNAIIVYLLSRHSWREWVSVATKEDIRATKSGESRCSGVMVALKW